MPIKGNTYEDQMGSGVYDYLTFRVWPDGTVQCTEDGPPHSHMSDDYMLVTAQTEEEAIQLAGVDHG